MIAGVGMDAADVERTRSLIERFGERFTRRVFSERERIYCDSRPDPAASYAARFAAKEAVMKTLGRGFGSGVRFADIEVGLGVAGEPSIELSRRAAERARELGIGRLHVSLTHESGLALAMAVGETA